MQYQVNGEPARQIIHDNPPSAGEASQTINSRRLPDIDDPKKNKTRK